MMMQRYLRLAAVGSVAFIAGAPALARQTEAPERARQPSEPPVLRPVPRDTPVPDIGPARPAYRPAPGQLVREGAFLRNRRGRLVQVESVWIYVFDRDAEGRAEPPMIVQPSLRLREMRRLLDSRTDTITFQTTGRVFVYAGRNYFLPTFFSVVSSSAERPATEQRRAEADGAAPTPAERAAAEDPSVASLIDSIKGGPRVMPTAPAQDKKQAVQAKPEDPTALFREGLTVVAQRGRVIRSEDGSLSFVSDTGAAKTDRPEPALVLLPCLNLESIERLVQRHGERLVFLISGQTYVYEGVNYLLPTLVQIDADREGNLIPAQ
ncbi:MAG: hypothetical protein SFZ24_08020 [Planctomycetota bacterium]|nr:hypothetical protein [Planctomycetota bacterium]